MKLFHFVLFLQDKNVLTTGRRVAPYTPTRSCVHIGVLKKKKIKSKTNKINKE
jgi:hypothetical protein